MFIDTDDLFAGVMQFVNDAQGVADINIVEYLQQHNPDNHRHQQ